MVKNLPTVQETHSIPGSGRSPGEGIGYSLQYSWASRVAQMVKKKIQKVQKAKLEFAKQQQIWASLVVQLVKNPPAMQETPV